MSLDTKTSVLLAGGGESPSLAVLVNGLYDPVDAGIVSDADVVRIDKNYFEIFVGGILVDPVRVEDAEVHASTTSTLLGNAAKIAGEFELVNTSILWLSVHDALGVGSLSATAADGDTVHNISLLSLVSEFVCLVRASRPLQAGHLLALAVLPCPVCKWMSKLQSNAWLAFCGVLFPFMLMPLKKKNHSYLTRSRKRTTSDCFFLHISSRYL